METTNSLISSNEEDRISKLPERLIHHILSFLDMEFVVQTCALSRRWRNVWSSFPYLNFDSNSFGRYGYKSISFSKFVDMVLILHDNPDLQRFHLIFDTYEVDVTATHVNTWILGALRRNAQDLCVDIDGDMSYQVLQCLFYCKSLTKLELQTRGLRKKLKIIVPKSIDLPRLKSLKLSGTSINDVSIINKLISSCPVLESLIVKECDIATDGFMNINIDSVKLKHFELSDCRYICYSRYVKANCIRLYAPNLASFVCKDYLSHDYSLENLSSLVTADIEMKVPKDEGYEGPEDEGYEGLKTYKMLFAVGKEMYANRMMKFLKALHNVKKLKLSLEFHKVISGSLHFLDSQPPQFCNLQCLDLVSSWCASGYFRAITYFLKISSNLESLYVKMPEEEDDLEAQLSLPCMLHHLKYIEFIGVKGCDNELKFLEFFLKNAMVLEELVLFCKSSYLSDRVFQWRQFNKKLQTLPSASSIRTIYVIYPND